MSAPAAQRLPEPGADAAFALTPREVVAALDRHIVGQAQAKRTVAVALRNRWRRQRLPAGLREEVLPKNILMIGPTGVGKTEISRRLARLAGAPFLKVEATRFTEVGYVGRDVEQIVRDLLDVGLAQARAQARAQVAETAAQNARERVLDALTGGRASAATREDFRRRLLSGALDAQDMELEVLDKTPPGLSALPGLPGLDLPGGGGFNLAEALGGALGPRTCRRRMSVARARAVLLEEESDKLLDDAQLVRQALARTENDGIVFLDEIDKICARTSAHDRTGEISRQGVQRDLLPLLEGTTVATRHGIVRTDHILFIASGAFHVSRPCDLLPEMQGRLPLRVALDALTRKDFRRILTEPEASLTRQYQALLHTDGASLTFTSCGIDALADVAADINASVENIGARRLHTIMEKVLDEISFSAPDRPGARVVVDAAFVEHNLGDLARDTDLSRFIL